MQGLYLGGYAKAAIHGTGGELRVHGQGDIIDCVTRERFVRFDGRFAHELLSFAAHTQGMVHTTHEGDNGPFGLCLKM